MSIHVHSCPFLTFTRFNLPFNTSLTILDPYATSSLVLYLMARLTSSWHFCRCFQLRSILQPLSQLWLTEMVGDPDEFTVLSLSPDVTGFPFPLPGCNWKEPLWTWWCQPDGTKIVSPQRWNTLPIIRIIYLQMICSRPSTYEWSLAHPLARSPTWSVERQPNIWRRKADFLFRPSN